MSGAILSHLTIIGVESKGDGGQLFMLAIAVWFCCAIIMVLNMHHGIIILKKIRKPYWSNDGNLNDLSY
jgi:hypothetical protein